MSGLRKPSTIAAVSGLSVVSGQSAWRFARATTTVLFCGITKHVDGQIGNPSGANPAQYRSASMPVQRQLPTACFMSVARSMLILLKPVYRGDKTMTDKKTAVVFGASGIIGRNVAERLVASGSWDVIGVSRHSHDDLPGSKAIACELTDAAAARAALSAAKDASHILFATGAARQTRQKTVASTG